MVYDLQMCAGGFCPGTSRVIYVPSSELRLKVI
jgi:hypothetical protein